MIHVSLLFRGIGYMRKHGFTRERVTDLIRYTLGYFKCEVEGHEGWCYPTWLNESALDARLDGLAGKPGFFKNNLRGKEFHAMILYGSRTVVSTRR